MFPLLTPYHGSKDKICLCLYSIEDLAAERVNLRKEQLQVNHSHQSFKFNIKLYQFKLKQILKLDGINKRNYETEKSTRAKC